MSNKSEGKIGAIDGDKLIEKITVDLALTRETPEGKGWTEALKAVMHLAMLGDLALTAQPRDLTPDQKYEKAWSDLKLFLESESSGYTVVGIDQMKRKMASLESFAKADEAKKESK